MGFNDLKVGDKVRIVSIPGEGEPNYYLHPDTRRVYKKIIARKRPVRIREVETIHGQRMCWYEVRLRERNGSYQWHHLNIIKQDKNWVKVNKNG